LAHILIVGIGIVETFADTAVTDFLEVGLDADTSKIGGQNKGDQGKNN